MMILSLNQLRDNRTKNGHTDLCILHFTTRVSGQERKEEKEREKRVDTVDRCKRGKIKVRTCRLKRLFS